MCHKSRDDLACPSCSLDVQKFYFGTALMILIVFSLKMKNIMRFLGMLPHNVVVLALDINAVFV